MQTKPTERPPRTGPATLPERLAALSGIGVAAALAAGCLLALMTQLNGDLARHTSGLFASWVAHGLGGIAAAALLLVLPRRWKDATTPRAPLWAYAGGFAGAATVVATSLAVNSPLALAGTLALGLVGQAVFGLAADRWGLFGLERRPLRGPELAGLALIVAGSLLLLHAVGARP